jgi:iron-sulfur cluster assembly protein
MTNSTSPNVAANVIHLTPAAVAEIKRLMSEEGQEGLYLRLGVTSGGCSGMSYAMEFDSKQSDLDREFDFDGLKVRVDLKALLQLAGTTLDFKGGLLGGGFAFSNPKAKRSCGCGSSFSA